MIKKLAAALFALIALASPALAQSGCPAIVTNAVMSAADWNNCFSLKQNVLGYVPLSVAGGSLTGRLVTVASNTARSGLNLPQGAAPSAPANGDLWTTSAGMFVRINGVTQALNQVFSTAGGDLFGTYPDPSVVKIRGEALDDTTPTAGNVLVGSGTDWSTRAISGDGTLSGLGVLAVTKINGVALGSTTATAGSILVGSGAAWVTQAVTGDISLGASGAATVTRVNGATLGTTTATSGNLLIGSGTAWVTQAISGDLSLASSGAATVGRINGTTLGTTTATSGNILIGSGSAWVTQSLSGDVTITNAGAATVARINGVALGSTAATSGNVLIGSGTNWVTRALSGDATISATGVITVAKVNGVTISGTPATGNVIVATSSTAAAWTTFGSEVVAITSGRPITSADNGKTLSLGAPGIGAQFEMTLAAASGFPANFCVTVTNADVYTGSGSGRGKKLTITGAPDRFFPWLMPQMTKRICNQANAWVIDPLFDRWRAEYNVQFYTSPSGSSDTDNDGLDVAAPYAHPSVVLEKVIGSFMDLTYASSIKATINVAAGTTTDCIHLSGIAPGSEGRNAVILSGAGSASTTLSCPTDNAIFAYGTANLKVQNIKLASGAGVCMISVDGANLITGPDVNYGVCTTGHILAQSSGNVRIDNNYSISGNAPRHTQTTTGGNILNFATTITCNGVTAFTTFADARQQSTINYSTTTFSGCGSVTGQRYYVFSASGINTGTSIADPSYFPGDAPGVKVAGGCYDESCAAVFPSMNVGTVLGGAITSAPAITVAVPVPATGAGMALRQDNNIAFGSDFYIEQSAGVTSWSGINNNVATSAIKVGRTGTVSIGTATLTLTSGAVGLTKMTASASPPGADGGKLELVCGTNMGTAKLVAYAGTSGTAVTVLDNIGSGVSGC